MESLIDRVKERQSSEEILANFNHLDEQRSFLLISELLDHSDALIRRSGLSLLKQLNWNQDNLIAFMKMGFALKHPSEIRYWYEAIAPQLGFTSILDLLETYIKIEPEIVSRAWYYLDLMIKSNSVELLPRLKIIQSKFREINDREVFAIN
jgi:hypothetical protein